MRNTEACKKYIGILLVIIINVLFALPDLFADGVTTPLTDNDSQAYKSYRLINHALYDPLAANDESIVKPDVTGVTQKKRPLFSITNKKTIFTDINNSEDADISTHIISPTSLDKNPVLVSAIHSSKTDSSKRSDTVGGLIQYRIKDLVFGAKYVTALNLAQVSDDNQRLDENSWGVSLKYHFADPLVFDIHYEEFDSGIIENNIQADRQYGISATYSFSFISDSDCELTSGYRKIEYDPSGDYGNQGDLDEVLFLFNLGF